MNQGCARPVTRDEFEQGYAVCGCGKYAHVFRAATLERLPKGYVGEICGECSCWMVAVEKLTPNAPAQADAACGVSPGGKTGSVPIYCSAKEMVKLRQDKDRLEWILPIVTGVDSDNADWKAMAIAEALMAGLDGREAIDRAMKSA